MVVDGHGSDEVVMVTKVLAKAVMVIEGNGDGDGDGGDGGVVTTIFMVWIN